ncbi:MAG: keratin associated protein [Labilithrix sp.]|nr:keratin associated protein [Labilithrix sp.]
MKSIGRRSLRACGVAAGLLLYVAPSCEENPLSIVCCTEFKVGADLSSVDFGLRGEVRGQFLAFAQASSDLASTANGALLDVQAACRNIAVELGASTADLTRAEQQTERERTTELCRLAVGQIKTRVTARAQLDIAFQPPVCEISVQAQARCEGECRAEGTCDVRVNPPVCRGGKLEIVCRGECTANVGATLYCEGSCTGNCQGECVARGGVRCNGRCEGTCTAEGSATGQAFDAQGNCIGTCQGTCSATPPGVRCEGSCKGQCDASCRAEANASVTCDGTCTGDYEPLRCKGGTLEGGCDVQASCKARSARRPRSIPSSDVRFRYSRPTCLR